MRYILEGEWSGYLSAQRQIVHREVVRGKRVERLRSLHAIRYTDGTLLTLTLREAKPREVVSERLAYRDLIRSAEKLPGSLVNVSDMPA